MSGETWLLSAMALSAPANAGTTSYTPEVREAVVVEMQRDCAAAENTFTGFAAVQTNIKNTSSTREETAAALKEQSTKAHKTISEIAPKTEVKFFNHAPSNKENEAEYQPEMNVILAPIEGKTQTNFDEKDIGFGNLATLAHEKQHEINAHRTIETSDGKTVLAKNAPMSLAQHYKLEQADEISANISECLVLREVYCEASKNMNKAKNNILSTIQNDEQLKKEFAPFISRIKNIDRIDRSDFYVKDNKICARGQKPIEVKDPELLNQFKEMCTQKNRMSSAETTLLNYDIMITHTNGGNLPRMEDRKMWVNGYQQNISKVICNPLSQNPEEIKKEMQYIGEMCAKNWMKTQAQDYEKQCDENTAHYFKEHNFQEVKANDENFNKTLSATLTIGGWDFSDAVKGKLNCRNGKFIEADNMINKKANELDVIKATPNLAKDEIYNSGNLSVNIAQEYTKDKRVGKKFSTQSVVWTAEYKQEFAKNLTNIQNQINACPKEQQEQAGKLLESLNLTNQKEGSKLSAEQIDNLGKLSTILDKHAPDNSIYKLNEQVQIASVPDKVKKEWMAIAQNIEKENFNPDNVYIGEIKRMVVEAYSGQELGKSAEQFTIPQSVPKTYDGVEQSTITMTDLSQPFLLDRYNKYAEIAAAKERVGNKLEPKTQTAGNTPTATKTSVNMAQLAAQRQGGR
ncbi:MAG: hypothetical protein J6C85_02865 [Alphaproteobacteria bacterium]|nr:hypothetical protein [Alphaproteobacteria bacterium]